MVAVLGGRRDPGYWETARMLLESALCLALQVRPARPNGNCAYKIKVRGCVWQQPGSLLVVGLRLAHPCWWISSRVVQASKPGGCLSAGSAIC